MVKRIDARGIACPQPVVMTKKALEQIESGRIEVIVDNKAASENVSRFARNSGCEVKVREEGKDFVVEITKGICEVGTNSIRAYKKNEAKGIVLSILSDTIGSGNDELGGILMRAFLSTLLEVEPKPKKLIFMNSGVKLTTEGSEFLDSLNKLQRGGAELSVCGTCLDYFRLKEKVRVGRVSNFFEITESLLKADKVIRM